MTVVQYLMTFITGRGSSLMGAASMVTASRLQRILEACHEKVLLARIGPILSQSLIMCGSWHYTSLQQKSEWSQVHRCIILRLFDINWVFLGYNILMILARHKASGSNVCYDSTGLVCSQKWESHNIPPMLSTECPISQTIIHLLFGRYIQHILESAYVKLTCKGHS